VIPLAAIEDARRAISGRAVRTPLVRLALPESSLEIHLKLECLQPIGSFKLRGAGNAIARLSDAELAHGVVTASAGNMAQGVAWCARERGVRCTVVVPENAPQTKLDAIGRLGGEVVPLPHEAWWQTLVDGAYPALPGRFVHPVMDDGVMAGNGTIGLEVIEDLPEPAAVVIPWGGGGLTVGIASAIRALHPATRIVTAEPETGAPLAASLAAGGPRTVDYHHSFVDGAGSRSLLPRMWELGRPLVDQALAVPVDATAAAVRLLAERVRVIAEGAGALALAAALSGQVRASGPIVCIVSGGNIDADRLSTILSGRTPA
jgi:threonine dehydratase